MKKKMIIITAIVLAIVMTVSLTACNAGGGENLLFGKELLRLTGQIDILTALTNKSADIGVFDSIMANYYMSTGTYGNTLEVLDITLIEEEYGIAAKKGNKSLMSKINEAIIALASDELVDIATQFGLQGELLVASDTVNPLASSTDSSWSDVVASEKLIIGYTVFAPIAFTNDSNEFTGFDIELAREVVAYLNDTYNSEIEIEFLAIDWTAKEVMLENGTLDLVWNGMTINEERLENMEISIPYLANKQAAVIRKADASKYTELTPFLTNTKDAIVAVENGSVAEDLLLMK